LKTKSSMTNFCLILAALIIVVGGASDTAQAIGTRENPVSIGTPVDLGDGWQIAVISVIPDATNAVLKENQFNNPPKAGNQFFLARIQAKYTGSGSDTFEGGSRLRAVGPSSVGYSTFGNNPGVIPDPLPDSEVFTGGIIEGNVGWEIKSSDANALVMYDSPFLSQNSRVYMALYVAEASSETPGDTSALIKNNELIQELQDLLDKGDLSINQSKYDEAIKALDKAIELCPKIRTQENTSIPDSICAFPWVLKGKTLYSMGKYDESIEVFDEAIRLDPNSTLAWIFEGDIFGILGKYDEAIKAFDEAIRLDSSLAVAWGGKGTALSGQGKHYEAMKCYDEAIKLDPNYATTWNDKGVALGSLGKYDESIKAFDEAIRLNPNFAEAWSNKGIALKALGRTTEANAAFAKAKELGYTG
jgi:tetratricopeptide (TPR) repeat protein